MSKGKKKKAAPPPASKPDDKKVKRAERRERVTATERAAVDIAVHKKYKLDQVLHCDALLDQLHRDQDVLLLELSDHEKKIRGIKSTLEHNRLKIIELKEDLPGLQAKRDALLAKVGGRVEIIEQLIRFRELKRKLAELTPPEDSTEEVSS